MRQWLMFLAVCCACCGGAGALELGQKAPDITLTDIRYLPREWKDFGDRKVYVFAFVALQDPASRELLPQLADFRERISDPRVEIAMVSTGTEDSMMQAAAEAVRLKARFTVLKDRDAKAAKALGIDVTPVVAVLDGQRRLLYRGSLEDARAVADGLLLEQELSLRIPDLTGREIVVRTAPEACGAGDLC
jgi:peroxiredoxin